MSAETVVYGYISLDPNYREHNFKVFDQFEFDDDYPFPNVFSTIRSGYGTDVISFARSLKSLDEEWEEWEYKFERLLLMLNGRFARVHLEHETDGTIKSLGFLCENGWDSNVEASRKVWTKWSYKPNGQVSEGVKVSPRT